MAKLPAPWTTILGSLLIAVNAGLFCDSAAAQAVIEMLQFNRDAVIAGEWWRLITGNLVHWSVAHFCLDLAAFLVVGFLFERELGSKYVPALLAASAAVGGAMLMLAPEVELYRGLSGVASGQFGVAVVAGVARSKNLSQRIVFTGALGVFATKLVYESLTGQMMFGTEGLGDLGVPLPLAHVAGTAGAFLGAGNPARSARTLAPIRSSQVF